MASGYKSRQHIPPDSYNSLSEERVFLVALRMFSYREWVSVDLVVCILTVDVGTQRQRSPHDTHGLAVVEGR